MIPTRTRRTPQPAPAGPSRAELVDQLATARAVTAAARTEAVDAEARAVEAERQRDAIAATAGHAATVAARVEAQRDRTALADMLVVLARWGANIDEGNPAAVLEVALRDAVAHGARAARAGDGRRAA